MGATPKNFKTIGKDEGPPPLNSMECDLFVTLPTYTSQVAESHIDALINARHKRTKKMQWTQGAHHVLQISAMMASDEWESKGQDAVLLALRAAA